MHVRVTGCMSVPIHVGVVNLMSQVCCTPRVKSVNGISSTVHASCMPINSSIIIIIIVKNELIIMTLSIRNIAGHCTNSQYFRIRWQMKSVATRSE